ncbi:2'-5' RNA ligase family protein [Massilia endophytica]|uniref:2'-5' RNA ligase family protein n=1 Tax=Massilia endophytica TaxID=2899220 RepID=UPI001E438863|nr:2'-5' RNA ligase family protein [Massilia endophytica]UGQ48784.1 hypothetical protein LSQ66_10080 [Massilia endophytica]
MPQQDLFGGAPQPKPRTPQPSRKPAALEPYSWFFALRPGAADAMRIDVFSARLLSAHGVTGKRIAPERLHISLDAVDASMVEEACLAADSVRLPAIEVHLDAAMTFSGGAIVLAGAKGAQGMNGVRHLRTTLGCAMADRGFKLKSSYEPHMTLGYDTRNSIGPVAIEPVVFKVAELTLVKSHVGLTRHDVVRSWTLEG